MKKGMKMDAGVSPVIAVILMVAITVVLSGVVFIWAQSFTGEADDSVEIINIRGIIDVNGVTDTSTVPGTSYTGLKLDLISGRMIWSDYRITVDDTEVFTISESGSADLSTFPTANSGTTVAGSSIWFSADTFDTAPLVVGAHYKIKIINIAKDKIAWEDDYIVKV